MGVSNKKSNNAMKQAAQYLHVSDVHDFAIKTLIRSHIKHKQVKRARLLYEKYLKKNKNSKVQFDF